MKKEEEILEAIWKMAGNNINRQKHADTPLLRFDLVDF